MDEDELSDLQAEHLIKETENEIFREATGQDHPADSPFSDDIIADQSRVEGWQGHLDNAELFETTRWPHGSQPGWDRPLAWAEEQDAIKQNELLRQELAARDQELLTLHAGPEYQEQLRRQQEDRRLELLGVATDDARADQHLAWVDAARSGLATQNLDRVNAALEHAHGTYGRDFETTYAQVSALKNVQNPMAQQIIQSIFTAQDPGEALMSLANSPLVRSLTEGRRGDNPPFMPRRAAAAEPAFGSGRRIEEDNLGYSFDTGGNGQEMESDVFWSAFR